MLLSWTEKLFTGHLCVLLLSLKSRVSVSLLSVFVSNSTGDLWWQRGAIKPVKAHSVLLWGMPAYWNVPLVSVHFLKVRTGYKAQTSGCYWPCCPHSRGSEKEICLPIPKRQSGWSWKRDSKTCARGHLRNSVGECEVTLLPSYSMAVHSVAEPLYFVTFSCGLGKIQKDVLGNWAPTHKYIIYRT